MGLDSIELVMECEDEFGISIPDEEAAHVRTIAGLHALIMRLRPKLQPASGRCRSASAFYRARRELVRRGVQRDAVRSGVRLRELMPRRRDVRRRYETLRTVLVEALPRAERWPLEQAGVVGLMALAACGAAGAVAWTTVGQWGGVGVGTGGVVAAVAAWVWLDSWVCTRVPVLDATLGELVREHTQAASAWGMELERAEVFEKLRAIVSEQLGVAIADVVPSARFVEDLGMD